MDKKAFRLISIFLALMVVFTFFSWKLDELRTPRIIPLEPHSGLINGQTYDLAVPNEALIDGSVWMLQTNHSVFQPLTVRRLSPRILAFDQQNTAVDGAGQNRLVWFSDRPLTNGQVVQYWPGDRWRGRVEILCEPEEEALLREAARQYEADWELDWEDDRLVISNAGRFTARQAQAALANTEAIVLDYSWGEVVLAQTKMLSLVWAGFLALVLLWRLAFRQAKVEIARFRRASREQYPMGYLSEAGVGLLAKGIAAAPLILLTIFAAKWLWNVQLVMPNGFLPDGSIFQAGHYEMWIVQTFPEGMSEYAVELAAQLRRWSLISGGVCASLTIFTVIGTCFCGRKDKAGKVPLS